MRNILTLLLTASVLALSSGAMAGNLSITDGKTEWKTTGCTEPTEPTSLITANPRKKSTDMNLLVEAYNDYAGKMQAYMDCISKDADTDSAAVTQTISQSAQVSIDAAQKKISAIHDTLTAKSK